MKPLEKISVLLAVYQKDSDQALIEALNSVIGQTYPPEEILIMQDGPVKKSIENIIQEYKEKYPELITHIVNEKNLGLGPTLARGTEACRNEIIARMDADDVSCPQRFEYQIREFIKDEELALLGGYIEEFEIDSNHPFAKRLVPLKQEEIYKKIKTRNPFNHMTVMFRKSLVMDVGNYSDLKNMEDYCLWIKMVYAGYRMRNLPYTLVMARTGNGMYDRRGGNDYIKSEKQIQQQLFDCKMINRWEYRRNLALRVLVRKMGSQARRFFYVCFLRKGI